jgi:hypothetical protein
MRLSAFMALVLLECACSPRKPIPGVVQPGLGETLASVPGPMPGVGPFNKFSDALMAACPVILSKPHATSGRPTDENFKLRWTLSQEYCAWIYYTPDHNSKSADLENPTCDGFFQYIPGTGELLRWANTGGTWAHEITGKVVWTDATTYHIDRQ